MPAADSKEPSNGAQNGLSTRGWANVGDIMPKIGTAVKERARADNPNIDLASAENWLIRPELIQVCKNAIDKKLVPLDFSYPRAFAGYPDALEAFGSLFNAYFAPKIPVEMAHLATAPGAAHCLDALFYNLCDPGQGILVASPYWNGFDFMFQARSSVVPIPVATDYLSESLTNALIPALEAALATATVPVKALLMTNPSNPLAQCYPKSCIEECIKFCHRHGLHYISDEVYALTKFQSADLPNPEPFVSALAIDIEELGCDVSRIHTVWSTSKDFGQSGVRMGCTVTQANPEMQVGLALASNTTTSSLSSIFVSSLLTSSEVPKLLQLNSERLGKAYAALTRVLQKHKIHYVPACQGLYLFARISPDATSWDEESVAIAKFRDAGVLISGGRGYHGPESEKGWARIGFAIEQQSMEEALRRIDKCLSVEENI